MTMNKMMVIGNLGTDPEMRYTPTGQAVTSFRVATNRRYTTSDGQQRDETEWFTISAWGRLAELCNQYLTKGQKVYAEGRLRSRSYEARDGQTRFVNEINASDVRFLNAAGSRVEDLPPETQAAGSRVEDLPPETQAAGEPGMEAEELPF